MRLNEQDVDEIKMKAQERIKYIKYMMTMIKERIKFNKNEIVRINTNKIMFDSNKKIKIKKKHKIQMKIITKPYIFITQKLSLSMIIPK